MNYNIFNLNNEIISKMLDDNFSIKIYSKTINILKLEKNGISSNIIFRNFNLKNDRLLNLFLLSGNSINIEKNNEVNIILCNYYGEILYKCVSKNLDSAFNNIVSWINDNKFVSKDNTQTLNYVKNNRIRLSI